MKRTLIIPFLLGLLLIHNPQAHAAELNLSTVQREQEDIKEQLQEITTEQGELNQKEQKELLELNQKYSRIVATRKALEKAEGYTTDQQLNITPVSNELENWSKVVVPYHSVPAEYKPIYQAAAERFNVDWEVLAAIHSIETSFSTINVMVSSVGAIGHMQFMPATFAAYGVDGNGDGKVSPWTLEDAIYSAANYLAANNYQNDKRKAIWHYNHAEWYVNDVLATAATFK